MGSPVRFPAYPTRWDPERRQWVSGALTPQPLYRKRRRQWVSGAREPSVIAEAAPTPEPASLESRYGALGMAPVSPLQDERYVALGMRPRRPIEENAPDLTRSARSFWGAVPPSPAVLAAGERAAEERASRPERVAYAPGSIEAQMAEDMQREEDNLRQEALKVATPATDPTQDRPVSIPSPETLSGLTGGLPADLAFNPPPQGFSRQKEGAITRWMSEAQTGDRPAIMAEMRDTPGGLRGAEWARWKDEQDRPAAATAAPGGWSARALARLSPQTPPLMPGDERYREVPPSAQYESTAGIMPMLEARDLGMGIQTAALRAEQARQEAAIEDPYAVQPKIAEYEGREQAGLRADLPRIEAQTQGSIQSYQAALEAQQEALERSRREYEAEVEAVDSAYMKNMSDLRKSPEYMVATPEQRSELEMDLQGERAKQEAVINQRYGIKPTQKAPNPWLG